MKKRKQQSSDRDVERALYHTLKDEGLLPPDSEEDIAALEEELGVFPAETADVSEVMRLLREEGSEEDSAGSPTGGGIEEALARAARRGRKIPREILERMERDREQAERERDDS